MTDYSKYSFWLETCGENLLPRPALLRSRLLQRHDPISLPRTAGEAERSSALWRQGALYLHPCSYSQVGSISQTGHTPNLGAGKLPQLHHARFSRQSGRVSVSKQAGRTNGAVHVAYAVQAGVT